jgi:alanyl-tRNA synthetase
MLRQGPAFPGLKKDPEAIQEILRDEENTFRKVLCGPHRAHMACISYC